MAIAGGLAPKRGTHLGVGLFHPSMAPDMAEPFTVLFVEDDVAVRVATAELLARRAKRLRPDLKVMLMTGYYSRAAEAQKLGKLLFKPVRGDRLEAELRGLARAE